MYLVVDVVQKRTSSHDRLAHEGFVRDSRGGSSMLNLFLELIFVPETSSGAIGRPREEVGGSGHPEQFIPFCDIGLGSMAVRIDA